LLNIIPGIIPPKVDENITLKLNKLNIKFLYSGPNQLKATIL